MILSDHRQAFTFQREKLKISTLSGFDFIEYENLELSREIGSPQLPVKIVQLTLPPGKDIQGITITDLESEYLDKKYYLFPTQPPQILSKSMRSWVRRSPPKFLNLFLANSSWK